MRSALMMVLLALAVGAQGPLVLPQSHAAREGSGFTGLPFGRGTPVRLQTVYADPGMGARNLMALGFRADGNAALATKQVDLTIALGHSARPVHQLSTSFAANRGSDHVVCFGPRVVALPALPAAPGPRAFEVRFVLDRPFAFDPQVGPLLVEIAVSTQAAGSYALDASWLCDSTAVDFGGPACGPAGGPALRAEVLTGQVLWGQDVFLAVHNAVASGAVVFALGTQEDGTWHGLLLPYDLSALGAAGCWLSTNLLVLVPQPADATGQSVLRLTVPADPGLTGSFLRFQGLALDPRANALGLTFSNGRKADVCGWERVGRLFQASVTLPDGQRDTGIGAVLELR